MNSGLVWFIVATVGSGLLGALLMAWLRRRFKFSDEDTIQETLGVSVSFVTLLFSFFLGFAIVNLWQAYEFADRLVLDEANEIRTLHDLLTQQPSVIDGDGNALIGTQVNQYLHSLIGEEWQAMESGKGSHGTNTDNALENMRHEAYILASHAQPPALVANEVLNSVVRINTLRRDRLNLLGPSLHPLLSAAIRFLAVFTLVGFFFLGGRHWKVQFLVDFIVVATVVLSVYLIHALDEPFNGRGFFVEKDVFVQLEKEFGGYKEK